MGLIEQLRLLDRALRDPAMRAALAKPRDKDEKVLAAVDPKRFGAVALRQSEMVRDRWWRTRFPATLEGAAHARKETTADVARAALASPHYDRREGEDETGRVLLGWLAETKPPTWLRDVASYEYVIGIGLPRRARGRAIDMAVERALLPEGTLFLEPAPYRGEQVALATRVTILPLEHRASELRATLASGKAPPKKALVPEALAPLVFAVEGNEALELQLPQVAVDIISLVAAPMDEKALIEGFAREDRKVVREAISSLQKLGVVARGRRGK